MMTLLRTIAGIVAVTFSIQPLASWAANPKGKTGSAPDKSIALPSKDNGKDGKGSTAKGGPICPGGRTTN